MNEIRKAIVKFFKRNSKKKIEQISSTKMDMALDSWLEMLETGGQWVNPNNGIVSLELPTVISNEFARLVTVEFESTIEGGILGDYLAEQFKDVADDLKSSVSLACALGGVVFKPYVSGDRIEVDVVRADQFIPLEYRNKKMTSGVFAQPLVKEEGVFTRLEKHTFLGDAHEIENLAFFSKNPSRLGLEVPLESVEEWADILPYTLIENVDRPLFSYFKMPILNTVDLNSPLGVSVFYKATDLIQLADLQFGYMNWEFEGGQLAVEVAEDMLIRDPNKEGSSRAPRLAERLYRERGISPVSDENFYKIFAPELRDESFRSGLDAILKRIEFNCGLAYGVLSDPNTVAKTATEVLMHKERSHSTVVDIQRALDVALEDLLYSMATLAVLYRIVPYSDVSIAFDWGDAVMDNPSERKMMFWQYVQAGKFPFWKYLVEFEGYTEKEARELETESKQSVLSGLSLFPENEGV